MSEFPVIRGRKVRLDANGLVCLTDIWNAAGKPKNQAPPQWGRYPTTIKLKVALLEKLNMGKSHGSAKISVSSVYYAKGGEGGGTFADVRLALSYAETLNAKLALEVKEVFLRYKAADPTLADDVLARATPEANEWAGKRAIGRAVRHRYTDTLQAHGVAGIGYAQCTDAQYEALFDKRAKDLKKERGLTKSGALRDAMETVELVYIAAAEQLASDRIADELCQGNRECKDASGKSASFIREAIERDKADRKKRRIL
ncbi:KilA-N domain-containing protein [Xanthobacter autotrophicus]|uniref:KilA-N domain-containing protein n=1 Tax=Xanthobacter autotrophicus TaxID=280 RepID=UPI00372C5739